MLSYRHSYHAGNFADVLKHIIQIKILEYLLKKDKPFDYIDTHAGAGLYHLHSEHAQKLQEYTQGIAQLKQNEWPELSSYFSIIEQHNPDNDLSFYPGSPLISQHFLRRKDRSWLFELHPSDAPILIQNTSKNKATRVRQEDGFKGLLSLLPPASRRGFILMDPSYEMKSDYQQVVKIIKAAHHKFATGIYALWYPVIYRREIDRLTESFKNSGMRNIQCFELGLSADHDARGMTASGMIVINPPWTLFDTMSKLLPRLSQVLGGESGFYQCEILVGE